MSETAAHFDRLLGLLELESQAEARQIVERIRRLPAAEAQTRGYCLVDLVARDATPGLGGRLLLKLARRDAQPLPWTRLGLGLEFEQAEQAIEVRRRVAHGRRDRRR